MAKETMQLGEGFSASVIKGGPEHEATPPPPPERPKGRHYVIGWGVIAAVLGTLMWLLMGPTQKTLGTVLQERPGLTETLGHKIGGVLYFDIIRSQLNLSRDVLDFMPFKVRYEQTHFGPIPNTIVNEGETALRDCFGGTGTPTCTDTQAFKYHGLGTSSQAIAEGDGGCITELTTQYNPDNTRATGSQTNNGANVYRTVGTNTVDASATVEEFCLMATSTGAGTMWTRILTGTVSLGAGDGLQTTYDLTIE